MTKFDGLMDLNISRKFLERCLCRYGRLRDSRPQCARQGNGSPRTRHGDCFTASVPFLLKYFA